MAAGLSWDPVTLILSETGVAADGDTTWDVRDDFYKGWKDLEQGFTDQQFAEFPRFMRYEGTAPISDVENTGTTFFFMNGWRFRPGEWDHDVTLVGVLRADPFTNSVSIPTIGAFTVLIRLELSAIVVEPPGAGLQQFAILGPDRDFIQELET